MLPIHVPFKSQCTKCSSVSIICNDDYCISEKLLIEYVDCIPTVICQPGSIIIRVLPSFILVLCERWRCVLHSINSFTRNLLKMAIFWLCEHYLCMVKRLSEALTFMFRIPKHINNLQENRVVSRMDCHPT